MVWLVCDPALPRPPARGQVYAVKIEHSWMTSQVPERHQEKVRLAQDHQGGRGGQGGALFIETSGGELSGG